MAATFHPQVMRGGKQSMATSLNTATTAAPSSTTTTGYAPPSTRSSSSSPSNLPVHGLQLDATSFPLHPSFASSSPNSGSSVRLITAQQYASIAHQHASIKLQDESILFPWLHGADIPNSAQAENFGYRNGACKEVPRYRGIVTVAAHGPRNQAQEQDHLNTQEETQEVHSEYAQHASPRETPCESLEYAHHPSPRASSCESIFEDPSCQKEDSTLPIPSRSMDESHLHLHNANTGNTAHIDHDTIVSPPHARNPTSASIATSYSTDSFCSSRTQSSNFSTSSSSEGGGGSSSSSINSGLASSASSVYSYDNHTNKAMTGSSISTSSSTTASSSVGLSSKHTTTSSFSSNSIDEEENALCELGMEIGELGDDAPMRNGHAEKMEIGNNEKGVRKACKYGPEEYTCLLVNSHHPQQVLAIEENFNPSSISQNQARRRSSSYSISGSLYSNEFEQEEDENDDESKYVCFQTLPISTNSISFRNFRLQDYKFNTISDFYIYHRHGGFHYDLIDLAKKLLVALKKMKNVRVGNGERDVIDYHVYVILEPFETFEKHYPHLVSIDSLAFSNPSNQINFEMQDHLEMRNLTKVSRIGENVYLGNTFDVPLPHPQGDLEAEKNDNDQNNAPPPSARSSFSHRRSPSMSSLSSSISSSNKEEEKYERAQLQESQGKSDSSINPHKFSICIEGRDMAAMCSTRHLSERELFLDELQVQIERERAIEEDYKKKTTMKTSVILSNAPDKLNNIGSSRETGKSKMIKKKKSRSSAFWFSSSSASSSSEEEDELESSSSESSNDAANDNVEGYYRRNDNLQEDEDDSEYEEFANGPQELLYDTTAQYYHNHGDESNDIDITLSPSRFSMSLDQVPSSSSASRASAAQTSGRCVSPPPYNHHGNTANAASSHSTPIKLQYKKNKSLRMARELEENKLKAEKKARLQAGAKGEIDSKTREVLEVKTEEIVHMECLSTAQTYNQASIPTMVDSIVEYVVWLRTQARPHLRSSRELQKACAEYRLSQESRHPHQQQPFGSSSSRSKSAFSRQMNQEEEEEFEPMARRILVHCTDGYTDCSVLALSYIMYDQAISLPQAYLYLQNDCQRSFFVYQSDVEFLLAIERKLVNVIKSQGRDLFNDDVPQSIIDAELEREGTSVNIAKASSTPFTSREPGSNQTSEVIIPRPGLFSRSSSKDSTGSTSTVKSGHVTFGTQNPSSSTTQSIRGPSPQNISSKSSSNASASSSFSQQQKEDPNTVSHAWFHSEHFEGHFPSRILDYVYLGNLSHASNALMLKELGITHVLSIGESALVPPSKQCAPTTPSSAARARTPTNSLWLEHSLGNIKVMDVQDINDDGVDSILPHLMSGIDFIEKARSEGGKILVHCRVGVSRSATIVIAQVMMDLNKSLAEAYLFVRARRLNILIQPTILFIHTLWTWEEEVRRLKHKNGSQRSPASRLSYPMLCTEIADLNYRYLNC